MCYLILILILFTTPMTSNYDLIVIGAGSGGVAAARKAASLGKSVLIIENKILGGTCVNLGCVPKKITYNLSHILEIGKLKGYCCNSEMKLDFKRFVERRDEYIGKLISIYAKILENEKIEFIEGKGELYEDCVKVGDNEFKFDKCIIATGSRSIQLYKQKKDEDGPKRKKIEGRELIEGHEFLKNSDDFFALKEVPEKCVIIGSGYIGIELSFILRELGSEVHVIARNDVLLSHFDEIIGKNVLASMEKKGIHIHFNSNVLFATQDSICFSKNGEKTTMDGVNFMMCAIGRDCELDFIKVGISKNGNFLNVDQNFQTSLKNVYAVGDIIGPGFMLTPVAIFCARILVDHLFNKPVENLIEEYKVYDSVPSVVFSHPPCASVGISEREARLSEGEVEIHTSKFRNLFYGICDLDEKEESVFKIVVKDKKVVGLHLFGMGCDEAIQGFAVAMKMGARYEDFKRVIPVHPTGAEEVVTMK